MYVTKWLSVALDVLCLWFIANLNLVVAVSHETILNFFSFIDADLSRWVAWLLFCVFAAFSVRESRATSGELLCHARIFAECQGQRSHPSIFGHGSLGLDGVLHHQTVHRGGMNASVFSLGIHLLRVPPESLISLTFPFILGESVGRLIISCLQGSL